MRPVIASAHAGDSAKEPPLTTAEAYRPETTATNSNGPLAPFALSRVEVRGFRNLADTILVPSARLIAFAGDNGAGKTNLMEAVSLLSAGRGLRAAPLAELARIGSPTGWRVRAEAAGRTGPSEIVVGGEGGEPGSSGRKVTIDDKPVRGTAPLDQHVRMVWLTPALDRLLAGPAQDRRRHFDGMVATLDPAHRQRLNAYEKAMRERNRLLMQPTFDRSWADSLEWQLAELGTALAAARIQAAGVLSATMEEMRPALAELGFPHAELAMEGELETLLEDHKAVEVEDIYRKMLTDSRESDRRAGRMLKGPHRSDLRVWHGVKTMAAHLCSTGEKKALLIATTLAHARAVTTALDGAAPVVLIDEIAAHLDPARRDGLFDYLDQTGAQVWMTGTSAALFAHLGPRAALYEIEDGTVSGPLPA